MPIGKETENFFSSIKEESGRNVEVLPRLELSAELTQSREPANPDRSQVSRAGREGSPPRGALPLRNSGLASLPGLHPRPYQPRAWLRAAQKPGCKRASVARGELFFNFPESTGKCLPCKAMPSCGNLNAPVKVQILPSYGNCGSQLTAPNLTVAPPNLTPVPSHHSHSSSSSSSLGLTLAGRLRLARHARLPRTLLARQAGPARPGLAAGAGTRRRLPGPGRDFHGEPASSRARPTHLCLLHKERQRCDPAQAAVWRLRLAVLELQHIARAAAADSPRIGQPERSALSLARDARGAPGPGARRRVKPGRPAASTFI